MRTLFCHQSVGADLVKGLRELAIVESVEPSALPETRVARPVLASARVGRNGDAASKFRSFGELVDAHAARTDFALMKLCYVDIEDTAQVPAAFAGYLDAVEAIRARHPSLRLGHVTMPLRARAAGPGAFLRRALGRFDAEHARNRARDAFNEKLRATFSARELFDLAAVESQHGARQWRANGDGAAPALAPEYTDDGGHLNANGRRVVARAFHEFLMQAAHGAH